MGVGEREGRAPSEEIMRQGGAERDSGANDSNFELWGPSKRISYQAHVQDVAQEIERN